MRHSLLPRAKPTLSVGGLEGGSPRGGHKFSLTAASLGLLVERRWRGLDLELGGFLARWARIRGWITDQA